MEDNGVSTKILWKDTKRFLGMPITFTKYVLDDTRLSIRSGLLNLSQEQIMLVRVIDFSVRVNLFDRIFGVGDIIVRSTYVAFPEYVIENVKQPWEVIQLLNAAHQRARQVHGVRYNEYMGAQM